MTKDLKIKGHVEGDIIGMQGTSLIYLCKDVGETSHAGRHYNEFTSIVPTTGPTLSSGIWVAPTGEELTWTGVLTLPTLEVTITGGSGRYEGATGGFTGTVENLVIDPDTGHFSYDYQGAGEATY
jgi:hypothetical protein